MTAVQKKRDQRLRVERTQLAILYRDRRKAIRDRLAEFAAVDPSAWFYEMAYCLLTPQSSAVNAEAVIDKLQAGNFLHAPFDAEPLLRDPRHYIRFHRVKARRLMKARESLPYVRSILASSDNSFDVRERIVTAVDGFGLKEATHFMRNIGRNGGLTILDRHILRNLRRYGAIRSVPKTLIRKKYLFVEKRFMTFADEIGIPVDELDLLFWSMETGEIRK